jgi:hypothetical protein
MLVACMLRDALTCTDVLGLSTNTDTQTHSHKPSAHTGACTLRLHARSGCMLVACMLK